MQLISIADLQRPDEELTPLIKQAQSLGAIYLEFIAQDVESHSYLVEDHGESVRRDSSIHASEMSDCLLKMVYSLNGLDRKPDPTSLDVNMKLRFRTGTALHGMLQSDFKRMAEWYSRVYGAANGIAMTFEREMKISPELQALAQYWNLRSHSDGAFTFWRAGAAEWKPFLRVGLELKSSSGPAYEERKKPEAKHLEQTCFYQAVLDLPLMWVLYYNKSNSNFTTPYTPWLYKFDSARWTNDIQPRLALAHKHKHEGTLPSRTEGKHCSWCPYAYECKPPKLNRANYGAPVVSNGMLNRSNR